MAAMKTRSGVELTDELIERLAERAEAGFDLAPRPSRGGRPSLGVGISPRVQFRVDAATFEALLARARAEDRGVSEIARIALERYLRDGQAVTRDTHKEAPERRTVGSGERSGMAQDDPDEPDLPRGAVAGRHARRR